MTHFSRLLTLIFCSILLLAVTGCASNALNSSEDENSSQQAGETVGHTDASSTAATNAAVDSEKPPVETSISPQNLYKLLVAEISAQRSNNLDLAIDNYLEVAKDSKDLAAIARAAQMTAYADDNKRALEANEIWVDLDSGNPEAHRSYAAVLLRVGRSAEAIPHFKRMIELSTDKPGKGFGVVTAQLVRVPDRAIAQGVMEQVIETYRHVPEAMFAYGHLLLRLAKFDEASAALDSALALREDWSNAVILKGRVLALGKGKPEAIKFLKSAIDDNMGDSLDVGISYARMLTENGQFEEAFEQTSKLTEMAPRNEEIHYLAGVLALKINNLEAAKLYLEKVVKLGKRLNESNYYLGQIAELEKDYNVAIDRYSSVKRGELYYNAQVRVVALLTQEEKYLDARTYIHTILPDSDKQTLQLQLLEGDIMREAGQFNEAKAFYTELLANTPNETSIRYARALIAEKLGELDLLESDLTTILENDPKNAQV
ncbi:MAG: tetratricopeptide repeat protein, partial [Thiohalomonadales bacterium]